MKKHYLTPILLLLFVVIAVGWFIGSTGPEAAIEHAVGSGGTQAPPINTTSRSRSARPLGSSGLLATHEPQVAFTPDGENVTPSFHVEMEALKEGLDVTPEDTTALIRMARLKQDGHQTEEAISYYKRYLDLRPEGRQAWLDLARGYGEMQRWPEALEATQAMLRHFPDDPAGLYNLGAIYANTSRTDKARTAWERVVNQDRDAEMKAKAEGALKRLSSTHP